MVLKLRSSLYRFHVCVRRTYLYRYIVFIHEFVLITATALPCYSCINLFSMLLVLEMHFKVLNCHARSRRVQLSGTIQTSDAWEVHEFDIGRCGLSHGRHCGGKLCAHIDGAVPHHALEVIIRILGMKLFETLVKPGWRRRL